MKTCLVTGYTGFVGTHLVEALSSNYELKLVGRKPSTSASAYQLELNENSNFEEALQGVDIVVHCAAKVHVMNESLSIEEAVAEYDKVNCEGTLNLARQAAQVGVKRFVFLSTIKVNGEETLISKPFTAFDEPSPKDPYGISKRNAEMELRALSNEFDMEVVIIRPPLVYGEGVKANFSSLISLVGKNIPLPFRSIRNKRSLVSVYNLVDLILTTMEHKHAPGNVFLVSDDRDFSTGELIAMIAKAQNKLNLSLPVPSFVFQFLGKVFNKQGVVNRLLGSLVVDIEHTKKTLGWKPPFSVEYGLKKSITESKK